MSSSHTTSAPLRGARLLLIEDDESLREVLTMNLEDLGLNVTPCESAERALERFQEAQCHARPYELVLTDVKLPHRSGLELLSELKALDEALPVIVLTAFGGAEPALEAMRRGAFHYVEKPVNLTSLSATLESALSLSPRKRSEHSTAQRSQKPPHSGRPSHPSPTTRQSGGLIASSPAMNEVLRVVDRVASSSAPVMILGESGVGKELIARALHERSTRRDQPFITVNCAAIPSELLESVLFGHERGAFTGAQRRQDGKFSAAHRGTLFLDEIAEMSPALQAKLLRVLQDGLVERLGSITPEPVDVRVVTATHQDLKEAMERGEFRRDLYYRLNVVPLLIPPLRERREDIPVLLRHFIRALSPSEVSVSAGLDEACLRYAWPGNVRELRNLVERMLLLREGDELSLRDLPLELREGLKEGLKEGGTEPQGDELAELERLLAPQSTDHELSPDQSPNVTLGALRFTLPPDGLDLKALEREVIFAALALHEGNQSACARYLNIPRHTLLYRLEKFSQEGRAER